MLELSYKRARRLRRPYGEHAEAKNHHSVILVNGLLWGGLLHALAGAIIALDERGFGRRSAIFLYVAPPTAALFLFVLVPSLLCCFGKREAARFLAWTSIPCLFLYLLIVVAPAAAI